MLIISFEYQGKTIESSPIANDQTNVDLMHLCQTTSEELENIKLSLNEQYEIMIHTNGQTPLTIERYGRKRLCTPNHPLRLFKKDTLTIGESQMHRICVSDIRQVAAPVSRIQSVARKAMMTGAAALVMSTAFACNPKQVDVEEVTGDVAPIEDINTPNSNDVDINAVPAEADAPVDHPQPMGDVVDVKDYPEAVGRTAAPEDPIPHPVVVGEPPLPPEELEAPLPPPELKEPLPPHREVGKTLMHDNKDKADKDSVKDRPRPMGKCDCSKPCPPPGEPVPTCFGSKCCDG